MFLWLGRNDARPLAAFPIGVQFTKLDGVYLSITSAQQKVEYVISNEVVVTICRESQALN